MTSLRLSLAAASGLLGAILVAVLVLGRPASSGELTLAGLDVGGVLVIRTEVYQRHGAKLDQLARLRADGDIGLHPESRTEETWVLLGPNGDVLEAVTASWTDDGTLYQRVRATAGGMVTERPALGVREVTPPRDGDPGRLVVPPSELFDAGQAQFEEWIESGDWSEVTGPAGVRQVERRRRIDPSDLIAPVSAGYSIPYYGDLRAVEMVTVQSLYLDRAGGREERFVVLADGSRVLVESRHPQLEPGTRAEWNTFVARVWGD